MNAGLLAVAVGAAFLPELMPYLTGGSVAAWAYVMGGIEAWALWVVVGLLVASTPARQHAITTARCICGWGAFEAIQRPACRLAYPMDRAPPRPADGSNLCDMATGLPMSWVSVVAALALASLVQEYERARR